jgi:hypothetical protein
LPPPTGKRPSSGSQQISAGTKATGGIFRIWHECGGHVRFWRRCWDINGLISDIAKSTLLTDFGPLIEVNPPLPRHPFAP